MHKGRVGCGSIATSQPRNRPDRLLKALVTVTNLVAVLWSCVVNVAGKVQVETTLRSLLLSLPLRFLGLCFLFPFSYTSAFFYYSCSVGNSPPSFPHDAFIQLVVVSLAGAGTPIPSITFLLKPSRRLFFTTILTHASSNACRSLCHCNRFDRPRSSLRGTRDILQTLQKCCLPSPECGGPYQPASDNPNSTDDSDVRVAALLEGLLITPVIVVRRARSPKCVPSR
jgi:hypothetical protein